MSSLRRILSSRANGAKSRGPVTEAGKLRAAANSLSHGLLARCTLLQGERGDALDNLMEAYAERFAPSGNVEYGFIEEMVSAHWRLRRLWAIETRSMDNAAALQPAPDALGQIAAAFAHLAEGPLVGQLHRYETRLHRMHQRAMYNLLWLRSAVPEEPFPGPELLLGPVPSPSAPEDLLPPAPNEPSPIPGDPAVGACHAQAHLAAPPGGADDRCLSSAISQAIRTNGPRLAELLPPAPILQKHAVPNEPSPISEHPSDAGTVQIASANRLESNYIQTSLQPSAVSATPLACGGKPGGAASTIARSTETHRAKRTQSHFRPRRHGDLPRASPPLRLPASRQQARRRNDGLRRVRFV